MKPRPQQSVFKYKSLAELERDLACVVDDQCFAPTVDRMNDTGEATLGRDETSNGCRRRAAMSPPRLRSTKGFGSRMASTR